MNKQREIALKMAYHEAFQDAIDNGKLTHDQYVNGTYTFAMLSALRNMAKADVYPDGTFSDNECNMWSMFR